MVLEGETQGMGVIVKNFAMISAAVLLAGCSSSGGGPSPDRGMCIWGPGSCGDPEPIKPTAVVIDRKGIGAETTYTADANGVTSVAPIGPTGTASATLTYDDKGALRKVTLEGPSTSRTWDSTLGAAFVDTGPGITAVSANGQDIAIAANPSAHGFEYQSFGAWLTGRGTGAGTAGVLSVGNETSGSNIPKSGTGIFTGVAGGVYVDQAGQDYAVSANASLAADFAKRTAEFTTLGSQKISNFDASVTGASDLDLTGTLTYGAGSNAMTGTVVSGSGMSGTANGRFYGPNAVEAGGIFHLRGPGVETYGGGFGTKRQ